MTLCFAAPNKTITADNKLIEYTGRIDFSDVKAPKFSYSGVSIRACFTGTSIAIIMDDNVGENIYNILIDGELLDTLHITKGKKTYKIAEGLSDKIHEIEVFKRTEEMFGKTQFYGFILDENASLVEIRNKRTKLVEYIGDSITCGYGNEGEYEVDEFGNTTENHYMTYAAITSRNFNARHIAVCKSGIGVYRNWDGPKEGNDDNMTNFYPRIFLWDDEPKYDFAETPDLICINLGSNDFSTIGGDSTLYTDNYLRLIDTLQSKYKNPEILCLLGPLISGENLPKVRNILKNIVDISNKKNKGKVSFFEMSTQTGDLGIGVDYHPSSAQHQRNAQELSEHIATLKDWKIILKK